MKKPLVVNVRIPEQQYFNQCSDGMRLFILRKQLLRVEKKLNALLRKAARP